MVLPDNEDAGCDPCPEGAHNPDSDEEMGVEVPSDPPPPPAPVVPASKPLISRTEFRYREKHFPDIMDVLKHPRLHCTSCGRSVRDLITQGKEVCHPFLETLLCEKCFKFYGDGEFSVDEDDGTDKYCRWCGQGGTLFLCSQCTAGFCKKCVRRNLPSSAMDEVENANDWHCYCCNPTPLFELRGVCWAAVQYSQFKRSGKEVESSNKRKRNSREDKSRKKRNGKIRNGDLSLKRDVRDRKSKDETSDDKDDSDGKYFDDRNEEVISGSGITKNDLKPLHMKFSTITFDCARLTKEIHKKMLSTNAKMINYAHVNSIETMFELKKNVQKLLHNLIDNAQAMAESVESFCNDWESDMRKDKCDREKARQDRELKNFVSSASVDEHVKPALQNNRDDSEKLESDRNGESNSMIVENGIAGTSNQISEGEVFNVDDKENNVMEEMTKEVKEESSIPEQAKEEGINVEAKDKNVTEEVRKKYAMEEESSFRAEEKQNNATQEELQNNATQEEKQNCVTEEEKQNCVTEEEKQNCVTEEEKQNCVSEEEKQNCVTEDKNEPKGISSTEIAGGGNEMEVGTSTDAESSLGKEGNQSENPSVSKEVPSQLTETSKQPLSKNKETKETATETTES